MSTPSLTPVEPVGSSGDQAISTEHRLEFAGVTVFIPTAIADSQEQAIALGIKFLNGKIPAADLPGVHCLVSRPPDKRPAASTCK